MKMLDELFCLFQSVSAAIFSIQGLENIDVNCEGLYRGDGFSFYVIVFGETKSGERTNASFAFFSWEDMTVNRLRVAELLQAINKDDFSQVEVFADKGFSQ